MKKQVTSFILIQFLSAFWMNFDWKFMDGDSKMIASDLPFNFNVFAW